VARRGSSLPDYFSPTAITTCLSRCFARLSFLSLFSLLVACGAPSNTSSPASISLPDRPFVVALDSAPTAFDPRFATDAYSVRITHPVFSALIRLDPQDRIVPDLAERWEIEGHRYTFYLRKAVRFHDGRSLTSADVRYTYESMLDPAVASPFRKTYEIIERIDTPNPQTVSFILRGPHAPFLFSLNRGIVPKGQEAISTNPVGSGPFSFISYEPDHAVELRAFPDYFGRVPTIIGQAPKIARLLFKIIPDQATRLLALQKGGVDLIQNGFIPDLLPRLQKNSQFKIIKGPSTTYSYLGFNLADPVLKNKNVRLAIAHAIDKEKIAKYIFQDQVTPAHSLLTERHFAYAPTKRYPFNREKAMRLLDEAKRYPSPVTGERFHLTYKTSQNEMGRMVAEVIQSQLSEIGIGVTIRSFEWGTFYSDVKSGNFQLFSLSWVGVNDPDIYYDLFHSSAIPPNGANRVRYQNKRMDTLLASGRMILQPNRRKDVYKEVQEILAEEMPYVSLWHAENVAVMKKEVQGYTLYGNGDFFSLKDVTRQPI
jgi:peptide/nickel transport system substrate-binding protein